MRYLFPSHNPFAGVDHPRENAGNGGHGGSGVSTGGAGGTIEVRLGSRDVIDVAIPQITIPIAPGRNLAVLVEAAVQNHILRAKGIDPAKTFIDRQAHQMRRGET